MADRDRHWLFDYEHHAVIQRVCQIPPSRGFTKLQSDITETFLSLSVRQNPPAGMASGEWEWRAREAASHATRHANGLVDHHLNLHFPPTPT
ncbi:hypothetical protein LTR17_013572 [Elasticomyces elasticus]|nr:hypothetical protein LTR17_013572 [Elasticomyces elasticus]